MAKKASYLIALIEYCDLNIFSASERFELSSYLIALIEYCDNSTKRYLEKSLLTSYLIALIEYCDIKISLITILNYVLLI